MAGKERATAAKAPQQKSWASRHKVALWVLIGVGAFLGINFGMCAAGHQWELCFG
jgi:hypothetical protein